MEFLHATPPPISVATGQPIPRGTNGRETASHTIEWNRLTSDMQQALLHITRREFASSVEQSGAYSNLDQNGISTNPTQLNTRLGNATLDALYANCIPRTKEGRITRAYEWAEMDDFLSDLLEVKSDFAILGFDLRCKEEDGGGEDFDQPSVSTGKSPTPEELMTPAEKAKLKQQIEFQKYLSKVHRKWDLTKVASDLLYDWMVVDSCILYWHVTPPNQAPSDTPTPNLNDEEHPKYELLPGVEDICALCPKDCEWSNDFGQNVLLYRVPDSIKQLVLQLKKIKDQAVVQATKEQIAKDNGIPMRWIEEILLGSDLIPLKNSEGDYWMIRTKKRNREGLSDPSMKTIFLWLEMRKTLKEGDFAVSFVMKHFILHVKMGESITSGPLAGQKNNWPTQLETDAMQTTVATATKTMRLVTNHTVSFDFIFPPKEMFDEQKYAKPESSVMNWGGITAVLMTGDGATNSSGYIGTKRVAANIKVARNQISYLFTEFFDHATIQKALQVQMPEESLVTAVFDENALKEARQLLDELKFGLMEGFIDPSTAQKELGRDGDSIRVSKLRAMIDNKNTGVFKPMNPKSGEASADEGGRPPNVETTQDEDTRNQPVVSK